MWLNCAETVSMLVLTLTKFSFSFYGLKVAQLAIYCVKSPWTLQGDTDIVNGVVHPYVMIDSQSTKL